MPRISKKQIIERQFEDATLQSKKLLHLVDESGSESSDSKSSDEDDFESIHELISNSYFWIANRRYIYSRKNYRSTKRWQQILHHNYYNEDEFLLHSE